MYHLQDLGVEQAEKPSLQAWTSHSNDAWANSRSIGQARASGWFSKIAAGLFFLIYNVRIAAGLVMRSMWCQPLRYHQYFRGLRFCIMWPTRRSPSSCPACGSTQLTNHLGMGTERIERVIEFCFFFPEGKNGGRNGIGFTTSKLKYGYNDYWIEFGAGKSRYFASVTTDDTKGLDFGGRVGL